MRSFVWKAVGAFSLAILVGCSNSKNDNTTPDNSGGPNVQVNPEQDKKSGDKRKDSKPSLGKPPAPPPPPP
jgi:hypothetical protein